MLAQIRLFWAFDFKTWKRNISIVLGHWVKIICYGCNRKLTHVGDWRRLVYVGEQKSVQEPGGLEERS